MTNQAGKKKSSGQLERFARLAVIFFLLCVLVNVIWAIYEIALDIIYLFETGVLTATRIVLFLLGLLFAAFVAALVHDSLEPLKRLIRRKLAIRRAIARCLVSLSAFRNGMSGSLVDVFLALFLRGRFQEITGRLPDGFTFRDASHQFSKFKSTELPRALLQNRCRVEQHLFSPVYAEWQSGRKPDLEGWVEKVLELEKRPHPLRHVLRLLNTISFRRFGIPPGEGWRRLEAKDIDQQVFFRLMWKHFWPAAEFFERWVAFSIDELDEPETEPDPVPKDKTAGPPTPIRQPLLLPPPARIEEPEPVPEEPEPVEEEIKILSEDELARRQAEAVRMTETALSFFTRDNSALDAPVQLLTDIRSVLEASLEYHPDPDQVHEQLAWLRTRECRLESFEEDFERELSRPRQPDDPWNCPWMEKASVYLPTGLEGDFSVFTRNALRFYLLEDDINREEAEPREPVKEEKPDGPDGDEVIPPPPEGF